MTNGIKIEFSQSGGFAPIPLTRRRLTIETNQLSPENSALLEELVKVARLDTATVSSPPQGAADYRIYTLVVTGADYSRRVEFTELNSDPELMALVNAIRRLSGLQPPTPRP